MLPLKLHNWLKKNHFPYLIILENESIMNSLKNKDGKKAIQQMQRLYNRILTPKQNYELTEIIRSLYE